MCRCLGATLFFVIFRRSDDDSYRRSAKSRITARCENAAKIGFVLHSSSYRKNCWCIKIRSGASHCAWCINQTQPILSNQMRAIASRYAWCVHKTKPIASHCGWCVNQTKPIMSHCGWCVKAKKSITSRCVWCADQMQPNTSPCGGRINLFKSNPFVSQTHVKNFMLCLIHTSLPEPRNPSCASDRRIINSHITAPVTGALI